MSGMATRNAKGQFVKGMIPHNKTEHLRKECPVCGTVFSVRPSWDRVRTCSRSCARTGQPSPWKGRKASPDTRTKQRAAKLGIRGEQHWNYKGGGIQSERHRLMQQDEYKQWRLAVFHRDEFTCQNCGVVGGTLHAHHIKQWADYPQLRYDIANGVTLCVSCHGEVHHG